MRTFFDLFLIWTGVGVLLVTYISPDGLRREWQARPSVLDRALILIGVVGTAPFAPIVVVVAFVMTYRAKK